MTKRIIKTRCGKPTLLRQLDNLADGLGYESTAAMLSDKLDEQLWTMQKLIDWLSRNSIDAAPKYLDKLCRQHACRKWPMHSSFRPSSLGLYDSMWKEHLLFLKCREAGFWSIIDALTSSYTCRALGKRLGFSEARVSVWRHKLGIKRGGRE